MDPINYLQGGQVDLGRSLLTGLSAASTIQQMRNAQIDRAQRQMLFDQAQAQVQLQQEQMRQAQELEMRREQARRAAISPSASAADRLNYLSMIDPKQAEQLNKVFEGMDKQVVSNNLKTISQTATLLNSPSPDIGIKNLEYMAEAAKNAGDTQEVERLTQLIQASKTNPKAVADHLATLTASMGDDGKKFYEAYTKSLSMRADAEKSAAEAQTAQTTAKYAEVKVLGDLEKQGWDINKIKSDINYQKEASKIAAMNAQIAREANALRREDLKIQRDERQRKIDEEISNKVADYETAKGSIENLKSTVSKALGYDMDVIKSATGPVAQYIPTVSEDTADFEETINTLRSQAFLAMIPTMKGTGALSEQEGKKLESSLASLSLRQSPGQLINNLKTVNTLMEKAKKTLDVKYGAPKTAPAPAPTAPAASPKSVTVDY